MAQKRFSTAVLVLILNTSVVFYKAQSVSAEYHDDHADEEIDYSNLKNVSTCPPWFMFNNTTNQCECGDDLGGIVRCDSEGKKVYIIKSYCMTNDDLIGIAVGSCSTNCFVSKSNLSFGMYYRLPTNPSKLNAAMCEDRWNRNGRLCGKCKDGYYPLVYSYDMRCTECRDSKYNWLKFCAAAFVPLTAFFVFVVGCGISASSPQLDAFIVISQAITTPANIHMILEGIQVYPTIAIPCQLLVALYGIWNLDFFRILLPPICLKISTLQALALDYIIAFYPLAFIVITYILIDLYDRHFCLLIWMWKPFKTCLSGCVNIKSSVINAFVTFLLLSYVKLLSVSFNLLVFVKAYSPTGKSVGTYLYYDASIEYFGKEHLPYGILASAVIIIFIVLPLLFSLLHPLRCFTIGRWPVLRVFLDSFQGYYKDGTDGTCDCRCFSSLYLLTRIALFVAYGFIKNVYFYPFASFLLLFLVAMIVSVQPFKPQFEVYNTIHVLLFLNLAVWFATCVSFTLLHIEKLSLTLPAVAAILPLFYATCLVLKWIYSHKILQKYFKSIVTFVTSKRKI